MSKIGRNDPCHCGSGKKYKHCHLKTEQEAAQEQRGKSNEDPPLTFKELAEEYNTVQLVTLLGALQLSPLNHGRNVRLERMARIALLHHDPVDAGPLAHWNDLKSIIESYEEGSYEEDEPTAAFAENVVFEEGNYIVYPGLSVSGTTILNLLVDCIFSTENELPEAFKKKVYHGLGFLLFLSNRAAETMGHTRGLYDEYTVENIVFPSYDTAMRSGHAICFSKEEVRDICVKHHYDETIVFEFVLLAGDPALREEDPGVNIVLVKPLIETDDEFVLYMPTAVVHCLIQFIYRWAEESGCQEALLALLYNRQFHKIDRALSKMGWDQLHIGLPTEPRGLAIKEAAYQFDTHKLAYVCFVENMSGSPEQDASEDGKPLHTIDARSEEVVAYLSALKGKQPYQVLCLYVTAETGNDAMFAWSEPSSSTYSISFNFSELCAIAYGDGADMLTLWKFSRIYDRTSDNMQIMALGGLLDVYAIYDSNGGSLLHTDGPNPIGGMLAIFPGSGNDFLRTVERKKDDHAVLIFHEGKRAYAKVTRFQPYAPIYIENEVSKEFRLVIESFELPIWITYYPSKPENDITWAKYLCEGIAFWLFGMGQYLAPALEDLTLIQFEIEVVIDERLLNAQEFIEKVVLEGDVVIGLHVEAPRIQVSVPYDFIYLVRRPDNVADKLLMKAVLRGLRLYIETAGRDIDLPDEKIEEIVSNVLQPIGATMFLFTDATQNVRLDDRGLLSIRYIHDADLSDVSDNTTRYLPAGYIIPEKIADKNDKRKLCNEVVGALIRVLQEKIAEFNGPELLKWLIRANERCVQWREFREIIVPAKIACFSSLEAEVEEMTSEGKNLANTALSTRVLIEFVATKVPTGTLLPSFDNVDGLLALVSQLISWGTTSDAIWLELSDPKMGLLPSGRIGIEKTLEKEALAPYNDARTTSEVFQYVEDFEKNYVLGKKGPAGEPSDEVKLLDEVYREENGLTLTTLSKIIGLLINEGFSKAEPCVIRERNELIGILKKGIPELSDQDISNHLAQLTLLERKHLGIKHPDFEQPEIYPWRYKRRLSFLMRPLIKIKLEDDKEYYYYGYRHLLIYFDNIYYMLYTGTYPKRDSAAMKSWLADVCADKGAPFRKAVKEWFQANTGFEVIDYEVHISPDGHLLADRDYGDIDLLVIDHSLKRIYPIECKNIMGGRNIYEMANEIKEYLGKGVNDPHAKISKHYRRDQWLQSNKQALAKFVADPDTYTIHSLVITADEIPLPHLKKYEFSIPVRSFPLIRMDGILFLKDL